jgi:peroxiredoxin
MDSMERLAGDRGVNPQRFLLRWTVLWGALLWACALSAPYACAADIGSKIPNFQLPDASGEIRSLRSFSGKAVAIVFWSYKCPVALAYVDRVEDLRKKYQGKGVQVFAIVAGTNESPAEIRANIANLKISIPVLLDSEGNVAERLGATHSPSVFIVDGEEILRYKGALDNNKRPGEGGRISYIDDALDSILSGRDVALSETHPFGCGIRLAKGTR